jgi:voltage-dependent anion channel protein 2
MAPPSYSDIGKQARDVFGKGYHFGLVKLEVKSKSASGLEFTAGGNTTTDGGKVSGSIESKMTVKEHGLKLTEKWNTDNSIGATVDYEKLMPGLKLTLDSSFQPNTGDKSGKFKTEYKHEKLLFNADMGLTKSPVVNMSAAVGHGPYALGYQTAFDSGKSALTKHNLALNYNAGDMVMHGSLADFKVYGGGVYLKNSSALETGITGSCTVGGGSTFAIGCKYALDKDAAVRAKVDTNSQIGLSYQQKLRDGCTVTLSTNLDGTKLNQPGHKLGICLEMEA